MAVIDMTDTKPNAATVQMLEKLLEHAKAGRLRTVYITNGWSDDEWTTCWVIDPRSSRRRLIGQVAISQFDLLTKQSLDDGDSILSEALG